MEQILFGLTRVVFFLAGAYIIVRCGREVKNLLWSYRNVAAWLVIAVSLNCITAIEAGAVSTLPAVMPAPVEKIIDSPLDFDQNRIEKEAIKVIVEAPEELQQA